ncbi:MAG: hypothetical protein ABJC89_01795, partial [Acidobacteriota bacterium]
MLRLRHGAACLLLIWVASGAASAFALEARVTEVRTVGPEVRASVDLGDLFPDRFQQVLQSGNPLHIRVQAEIWEDRPLWDRLVRPALVTVFRIVRDPATARIAVSDAFGPVLSVAAYPPTLSLRVDVAPADTITDGNRYYVRMIATVGTIAERDVDDAEKAVFGRDEGTVSLGKVGRFLFHTVLQVSDYLQSVTSEARTR